MNNSTNKRCNCLRRS